MGPSQFPIVQVWCSWFLFSETNLCNNFAYNFQHAIWHLEKHFCPLPPFSPVLTVNLAKGSQQ